MYRLLPSRYNIVSKEVLELKKSCFTWERTCPQLLQTLFAPATIGQTSQAHDSQSMISPALWAPDLPIPEFPPWCNSRSPTLGLRYDWGLMQQAISACTMQQVHNRVHHIYYLILSLALHALLSLGGRTGRVYVSKFSWGLHGYIDCGLVDQRNCRSRPIGGCDWVNTGWRCQTRGG